ncbi:MAG: hypothetical protein KDB52_03170 [Solirubrobacterales bacterium]|nr:hypothetical protein [Solirubrobacterales bacterium]
MTGPADEAPESPFDAETCLNSLEPIGWKLGLERMEMLSDELGRPQDSYATIHVVGTNGKSSVSRMIAAICEAHGYRAGCSLSPHLARWSERVVISGGEQPDLFAECVERTAEAAARVNDRLDGEEVTQFELATAAAFLTLAEAGVQVAAIEAGLGGRLDATNSINSLATVLTSIGLDHTEYLGDTEQEIAVEKLAVLRPGSILVTGPLSPEVKALARATAQERECEIREVDSAGGSFQRTNFAVAEAAAACFLGETSRSKSEQAVSGMVIPGRLEKLAENPLVLADVAHNPAGARALAESLSEAAGDGPVFGVIGVLADKDAPGMLAELARSLRSVVFTGLPDEALAAWGRPGARAWAPQELSRIATGLDLPSSTAASPAEAVEKARKMALEAGGTVLITGSHFLLAPGAMSGAGG